MDLAYYVRQCTGFLQDPDVKRIGHAEVGMIFDEVYGGAWPAQLPRLDGRAGSSNSWSKETVAVAIKKLFKQMEEQQAEIAAMKKQITGPVSEDGEKGEVINIGPLPEAFQAPAQPEIEEDVISPEDLIAPLAEAAPSDTDVETSTAEPTDAAKKAIATKVSKKSIADKPSIVDTPTEVTLRDQKYPKGIIDALEGVNITTEQQIHDYVAEGNDLTNIANLSTEDIELLEEVVNSF